jgi:hypothetical protein
VGEELQEKVDEYESEKGKDHNQLGDQIPA